MPTTTTYREQLRALNDWDDFLLAESGLPGARANLALAAAAADEGDETRFRRWLDSYPAETAPSNNPGEFLALCGVVGLGRLLAEGDRSVLPTLRACAADSRWRLREGVALALQRWDEVDMDAFIDEMTLWSEGSLLEKRAAAGASCEPRLLKNSAQVARILTILDTITASIPAVANRKSDEFLALRKGLGYCWSVAVAAHPEPGKALMDKWLASDDKDIRWIMRENLKKDRLVRMDVDWLAAAIKGLEGS